MKRLTSLIPTPRPCRLAGQDYEIWPATLEDVARLQTWLDRGWPDPLDEVWPVLGHLPGDEERAVLASAESRAEGGPPLWDEDTGRALFGTVAGTCVFVATMLRRGHPETTKVELYDLVFGRQDEPTREAMTPAEYARARRAFFGVDSHREILRLMLGPTPDTPDSERLTWGEVIDEIARDRGWTYPQVYALTLNELGNARRHGKPPAPIDYPILPGQDPAAVWREVCLRIYGKPPEEAFPEEALVAVEAW